LIQNQMLVQRHDANKTELDKAALIAATETAKASKDDKEAAEQIPGWMKKITDQVSKLIPDTEGLKESYAKIKTNAAKFGTDVTECIKTLKASPALKTTNTVAIKAAVTKAFKCMQTGTEALVKVVKDAAKTTETTLTKMLPGEAGKLVKASLTAVEAAANGFAGATSAATKKIASANVTMLCPMVTSGITTIEDKVVDFVSGMDMMSPTSSKEGMEKQKKLVEGFIKDLPKEVKDKIDAMLAKVQEAADAVLENIPKAITEFKDGVVSALKDKVCPASELPAGASSLHMGLPLLLLVSVFFRN